jgi:hypothetical protein
MDVSADAHLSPLFFCARSYSVTPTGTASDADCWRRHCRIVLVQGMVGMGRSAFLLRCAHLDPAWLFYLDEGGKTTRIGQMKSRPSNEVRYELHCSMHAAIWL